MSHSFFFHMTSISVWTMFVALLNEGHILECIPLLRRVLLISPVLEVIMNMVHNQFASSVPSPWTTGATSLGICACGPIVHSCYLSYSSVLRMCSCVPNEKQYRCTFYE